MSRRSGEHATTRKRADTYDSLMPLLRAMLRDFQELAKKKPDGVLNSKKVAIVNRLLSDLREVVKDEPSERYLDLLDEDNVPQNSDVLLILGQFDAAMKSFRSKYFVKDTALGDYDWLVNDD
jgi:hypothetical protein